MRELLAGTGTFVVHNFMDAAECVLWRDRAEVTGFGEAPINTFRGAVRPNSRVRSLYTALVYLNDDFEGGQTRFYEHDTLVRPTQGMALFFVHNQLHEGCEVVSGRKYVLRTDVMFDLSSTD